MHGDRYLDGLEEYFQFFLVLKLFNLDPKCDVFLKPA